MHHSFSSNIFSLIWVCAQWWSGRRLNLSRKWNEIHNGTILVALFVRPKCNVTTILVVDNDWGADINFIRMQIGFAIY